MNNALSIVTNEGSANEFPVLKAFQEYIDAEQAKARKRMLGLSIFFIILLVVVVVTFVLVLTTVVNRNQALSDRLLDYALKEKEKTPQVVQQPAQPVAPQQSVQDVLRPFFERLEREQAEMKALYEKQQKETKARYEQQQRDAITRMQERAKANEEELRKAKADLEKERMRIKRENDRQEEIERHRRRLYPDYYKIPDAASTTVQPPPPSKPVSQPQTAATVQQPVGKSVPASVIRQPSQPEKSHIEVKKQTPLSNIKPVTYFNVDDDDGVPFLLETPQKNNQK